MSQERYVSTYRALTYDLPLLKLVNNVANTVINLGQPIQQWTNDLDVSLLKKFNKKTSEVCTIETIEADLNQQASLHLSKRMMNKGIMSRSIPVSQYSKKRQHSN